MKCQRCRPVVVPTSDAITATAPLAATDTGDATDIAIQPGTNRQVITTDENGDVVWADSIRYTAGVISVSVTDGSGTATITFPAGLFTAPPTITGNRTNADVIPDTPFTAAFSNVTTTSATVILIRADGQNVTGTFDVAVQAIQAP